MAAQISTEDVQIGITLASIAYLGTDSDPSGEFEAMAKALQQKDLPTKTQWGIIWGPVPYESNLMYIVQGPKTEYGRKYAVAIRGTIKTVKSILEDVELDLVDLPWSSPSAPAGTQISSGIRTAFDRLLAMCDSRGRSALDVLGNLKPRDEILVCGHSLGGCLTTVMSLYLKDTLSVQTIKSVPFAGQTAGTIQFADWYSSQFTGMARWANRQDIVPRLWNHSTLEQIKSLYPGGPYCDPLFAGLIDIGTDAAKKNYFQPGPGTLLPGNLYREWDLDAFENEVEAQHDHLYYMYLTGIPLSVIQGTPFDPSLGSGWWPPQADDRPTKAGTG